MFGTKVLEERESKYNGHLRVLSTWGMGTYIQSNGLTQSGGIVEQIWKQTLKQLKDNYNDILILGLGGGTLAKLLRKKYPNAKITGIEIDKNMIDLGKKYLDLDKYKVDIKIGDARKLKFNKYDLVIVDTYLADQYIEMKQKNNFKTGMIVFNRLFYSDKKTEAIEFGKKLEKVFKKVEYYYPEANLIFFCYNS